MEVTSDIHWNNGCSDLFSALACNGAGGDPPKSIHADLGADHTPIPITL